MTPTHEPARQAELLGATLEPVTFDPQERQREKQASRDADERAFVAGESGEAIDARNAFLTAARTIVHWDRSRPF